jgi:hypothetical protein
MNNRSRRKLGTYWDGEVGSARGRLPLPVQVYQEGALARIYYYERIGGRCPASDFLESLESSARNKFDGPFFTITRMGAKYCNDVRFKQLHGRGKPLWEFKEHAHRLYCLRQVLQGGIFVNIVLFYGWAKKSAGRTEKEDREIQKAVDLYNEFLQEYPGGNV